MADGHILALAKGGSEPETATRKVRGSSAGSHTHEGGLIAQKANISAE
jgi:hypothetical protein